MAEAARWRTWRKILEQKNEYLKAARRRAQIELCKALDAAGQIYVFGRGTQRQFGASGLDESGVGGARRPGRPGAFWWSECLPGRRTVEKRRLLMHV